MKVLHVCTEAQLGGAGIAAYRLHKGLRSLNIDSMMLVNKQALREDGIHGPSNTADKMAARLVPVLDRIPGYFSALPADRTSASWMPNRLPGRINAIKPDILNLHWVNDGFMRIETLPHLKQPIVWTLHDMWAFSGGEHYVGDNRRYKEGYTRQNKPTAETGLDINRWIWNRKRKAWANIRNLVIATPSQWLANCARESVLFENHRVEVLPNGIDPERFHPMDHSVAREILGLPKNKKLILFGAFSATSDKRKGFHLLVETLKKLEAKANPDEYELVIVGASSLDESFHTKSHCLGRLNDEISMALVYAAADVFVAPSLEDNLPNTVLESLACGTPVVAFNIGGMPDMVSHEKNGFLARGFDTDELAAGLQWILDDEQRWKSLSQEARKTIMDSFTLECAANRYRDIYDDILRSA
ncbi:MAG TPA: glycosyltransferase [Gammaproteobacteria bacterium]|nr:glycosyltransferase [Gammaproteobacteria bacterium]